MACAAPGGLGTHASRFSEAMGIDAPRALRSLKAQDAALPIIKKPFSMVFTYSNGCQLPQKHRFGPRSAFF